MVERTDCCSGRSVQVSWFWFGLDFGPGLNLVWFVLVWFVVFGYVLLGLVL